MTDVEKIKQRGGGYLNVTGEVGAERRRTKTNGGRGVY